MPNCGAVLLLQSVWCLSFLFWAPSGINLVISCSAEGWVLVIWLGGAKRKSFPWTQDHLSAVSVSRTFVAEGLDSPWKQSQALQEDRGWGRGCFRRQVGMRLMSGSVLRAGLNWKDSVVSCAEMKLENGGTLWRQILPTLLPLPSMQVLKQLSSP